MMADSSQKLPWIVASKESQNVPQPQILPLVAVERPDPPSKWLNKKVKEKKDKWSRKRLRRRKQKKKKRKGRKRRIWEEEAIGFTGNSTATAMASFPGFKSLTTTNIELRFRSWKPDGVLLESRGRAGDFLLLSLVGGKLQLRWELGSGPGMLVVGEREEKSGEMGGMGLGRWHRVKVKRYHRDVQLTLDRQLVVIGRLVDVRIIDW